MTEHVACKPALSGRLLLVTVALSMGLAAVPASGQVTAAASSRAAQTAPTPKQAFEVSSIRPLDPRVPLNDSGPALSFPSNRFTTRIINVEALIEMAFGVVNDEISGGPDWTYSQLYSIDAKVEGDALLTKEQMRPLLQDLLEERFHLKAHREQKIVPGYVLIIAKGGFKLQPTKGGSPHFFASGFELKFLNDSAEHFAKMIGVWTIKKPVVDRTGLDGMYDFDLKFAPQDGPLRDDPRYSNLPNIFTAAEEQLGLKLVPQEVPVDYLVIDHVEPPSEN